MIDNLYRLFKYLKWQEDACLIGGNSRRGIDEALAAIRTELSGGDGIRMIPYLAENPTYCTPSYPLFPSAHTRG